MVDPVGRLSPADMRDASFHLISKQFRRVSENMTNKPKELDKMEFHAIMLIWHVQGIPCLCIHSPKLKLLLSVFVAWQPITICLFVALLKPTHRWLHCQE